MNERTNLPGHAVPVTRHVAVAMRAEPAAPRRATSLAVAGLSVALAIAGVLVPTGQTPSARANTPLPPTATFTPFSSSIVVGQSFTIATTITGTVTSVTWSADDGWSSTASTPSTNTLTSPSHAFATTGIHVVSVLVCNASGCGTASTTAEVLPPPVPTPAFTASPNPVLVGDVIAFASTSTGTITSLTWSAADGWTAAGARVTHAFAAAGNHSVTLQACNAGSCASTSRTISVIPLPPVASFMVTPGSGTAGITSFALTDTSTGAIVSRAWSADDGWTSRAASPSHAFAAAGTHTFTLSVANYGGSSSVSHTVLVVAPTPSPTTRPTPRPTPTPTPRPTPRPTPSPTRSAVPSAAAPAAGFAVAENPTTTGKAAALIDTSLGTITSYKWSADDGAVLSSTSDSGPTVMFSTPGTHTVTLTVTGPGGSSTVSHTIDAVTDASTAAISASPPPPAPGGSGRPFPWSDWLAYLLALAALGVLRLARADPVPGGRWSWGGVAVLTTGAVALLSGPLLGTALVGLLSLGVAAIVTAAFRPLSVRRLARVLVAAIAMIAAAAACEGDLLVLVLALFGIAAVEALGLLDDPIDPWTPQPARPTDDPTPSAHDKATATDEQSDTDRWAEGRPSASEGANAGQLGKESATGWSVLGQ